MGRPTLLLPFLSCSGGWLLAIALTAAGRPVEPHELAWRPER